MKWRGKKIGVWIPWFAWYPVKIDVPYLDEQKGSRWVWLEKIVYKRNYHPWGGAYFKWTEYGEWEWTKQFYPGEIG